MKKNTRLLSAVFLLLCAGSLRGLNFDISRPLEINAAETFTLLPHSRTTGSLLENWLSPVIFQQVETGGLSRFDALRFTFRGISWREQNYLINGVDITDPFQSGQPLFDPSWDTIRRIVLRSAAENNPHAAGLEWTTGPDRTATNSFRLSWNGTFPGGEVSFIPPGYMDREPSYPAGASRERRRFVHLNEAGILYDNLRNLSCGLELLSAARLYPTLRTAADNPAREEISRALFSGFYEPTLSLPTKISVLLGYEENGAYGAPLRLDHEETLDRRSLFFLAASDTEKRIAAGTVRITAGLSGRFDDNISRLTNPFREEFVTESGPRPFAGRIDRMRYDGRMVYDREGLRISAGTKCSGLVFQPKIFPLRTETATNGEVFRMTVWDEPGLSGEYLLTQNLEVVFERRWGGLQLEAGLYADILAAFAGGRTVLNQTGLGPRILGRYLFSGGRSEVSAGYQRVPARPDSSALAFLNPARPSGKIYADVDGDGQIDEKTEDLYATTGGRYHQADPDLKRPFADEIFLHWQRKIRRNMRFLVQGSTRVFSDYYIVEYEEYAGTTVTNAGFDIYTKPAGEDFFVLANQKERSAYAGLELQFTGDWKRFYLNGSFCAFIIRGFAPLGNGPDYNEYPFVSEETASPNARIHATGRLDGDRGYTGNLLAGFRIARNLSTGLTLKYRDGEPFTPILILRDEAGMPVRVLRRPRGDWNGRGVGRYTFAWNIDWGVRYERRIAGLPVTFRLNISNLLGSETELLESYDPESGRRALEAVPPRMITANISTAF